MEHKFESVVKILEDNHIKCTVYLSNNGQITIGLGAGYKISKLNKVDKLLSPLGFEQSTGIFDQNPNVLAFAASLGGTAVDKEQIIK